MTLQEIQYKAQGIIHKWRDDDSAPYIEFVEELAHMIVPEPSKDLEEAAEEWAENEAYGKSDAEFEMAYKGFIAGYKYHADHAPLPEDTVLFQKGVAEGKRLMMEEAVEAIISQCPGSNEIIFHNPNSVHSWEFPWKFSAKGLNKGDKVRVIICKKED